MNIGKIIFLFFLLNTLGCMTVKLPVKSFIISASKYNNMDITSVLAEILSLNPQEIIFEKGNYRISSYVHISNQSNLSIYGNNAILSFSNLPGYSNPGLFKIFKSQNISISNLNFVCKEKMKDSSFLISAIYIVDSREINLQNCNIKNRIGDGIHIASTNENSKLQSSIISILDCVIDSSRRNGISIVKGNNILIRGGIISNTNGQHPQAGVDIEADNDFPRPAIDNVVIENVNISGNYGNGISIPHLACPSNIAINSCSISNNLIGIWTCGIKVTINQCNISYNKSYGICSIRYPEYNIPLDSLKILNCNILHNDVGIQYRGTGGLIQGNTIRYTVNEAIEALYKESVYQDVLISDNIISNINGRNAIESNFSNITIHNNKIDSCTNGGVAIFRGRADIISNIIENCTGNGITVSNAESLVYKNTLKEIKGYFMLFVKDENLKVQSKVSHNNFKSKQNARENIVIVDSNGSINELVENTFKFPSRQKIKSENNNFKINGADIIK